MPSLSLANLPAEIRNSIYEHILPRGIDVRLKLTTSDGYAGQVRHLQMDTKYNKGIAPCGECMEFARTTCALAKTCKTVHVELSLRLYTMSAFVIVKLPAAAQFVNNIPTRCRPLIKNLAVVDYCDGRVQSEKVYKFQLQSIAQSLTGLRHFEWKGINRGADIVEKGTMWKPYELRKMLAFMNASTHLRKVFYKTLSCPYHTKVRFTDSEGGALDSEEELDIQAEYRRWLNANRDRKANEIPGGSEIFGS